MFVCSNRKSKETEREQTAPGHDKVILILAGGRDPQGMRAAGEIRARGGRVVWCDTAAFPEQVPITSLDGRLSLNRRKAPMARAAYLRGMACHPLMPHCERDLDERPRGL